MKQLTRSQLRGEPLEEECYKAKTINELVTQNENICAVCCLGLYGEFSDGIEVDDIQPECLKCGAYVYNEKIWR